MRFLGFFSIDSWQLLDPLRCFFHWQIPDNTSTDSFLSRISARQISKDIAIHRAMISLYSLSANQISFLTSLSQQKIFSLAPNNSHSLKTFYPCVLRPRSSFKHLVSVLIFSFFIHSCILDLGFRVFQNFWGFWVFLEILGLAFVKLLLYAHA